MISSFLNFFFLNRSVNYFIKPSIVLGESNFVRLDSISIFSITLCFIKRILFKTIAWKPLNFVSNYLGRISCYEFGFLPNVNSKFSFNSLDRKLSFSYFCGVDVCDYLNFNSFIVYQGFFKASTFLFNKSNIILPVATYLERNAVYLNLEGRLRFCKKVVNAFKFVLTDFEIIRVLLLLRKNTELTNFSKLTYFYKIMSFFKKLINYFCQYTYNLKVLRSRIFFISGFLLEHLNLFNTDDFSPHFIGLFNYISCKFVVNSVFGRTVNNYYYDNCYSKNSKVMSICAVKTFVESFSKNLLNFK